jgi:hypothetical protein
MMFPFYGHRTFFDVALCLLKRHSGIVWDPGRFAGLLHGGDVRRLGNPTGAPALGLTPWGCPTNCKTPLSRGPYKHYVVAYAADPLA